MRGFGWKCDVCGKLEVTAVAGEGLDAILAGAVVPDGWVLLHRHPTKSAEFCSSSCAMTWLDAPAAVDAEGGAR